MTSFLVCFLRLLLVGLRLLLLLEVSEETLPDVVTIGQPVFVKPQEDAISARRTGGL